MDDLTQQADKLLAIAPGVSQSDLTDLAAQLQHALDSQPLRAAIVGGLALKGGRKLVREMRHPLAPAPNLAEIKPIFESAQ